MIQRHLEGVWKVVFVLLSTCTIALFGQACQSPVQHTRIACGSCEDQDHIIRLQPTPHQDGQPTFTHPFLLSPEDWKVILKSIHVQRQNQEFLLFTTKGPVEPAFTGDEVEYLSTTLSRVFGQARPEERVVFALSRHQSDDLTELTTGGWFVTGPSLHFVLANYRYAVTMPTVRDLLWQDPMWTQAGPFYDVVPGEHQTVVEEQGSARRFFPTTLPSLSIAYKPLLLGEPPSSSAAQGTQPGSDLSSSPNRTPSPKLSLEERLQTLKRLKDQALITDEEYRTKKKQVLDQF
ncbi:MAG TPA: SHOCT domain-containing protein [Nitrospira sp.]|nr:SHOCT domain-containing protein [Nitrospira sp.]